MKKPYGYLFLFDARNARPRCDGSNNSKRVTVNTDRALSVEMDESACFWARLPGAMVQLYFETTKCQPTF